MGTTKLNIGKIPISKGEYQEGTAYQRLNQVTMLGSTYQSKIDDNTSAPAQMGADGAVENINTDKWLCIAVGNVSAARKVVYNNETSGLEAGNVQEAIDEVGSKVSDLSTNKLNKIDLPLKDVKENGVYFVDELGNAFMLYSPEIGLKASKISKDMADKVLAFVSLAQELGTSENLPISQKAVKDAIENVNANSSSLVKEEGAYLCNEKGEVFARFVNGNFEAVGLEHINKLEDIENVAGGSAGQFLQKKEDGSWSGTDIDLSFFQSISSLSGLTDVDINPVEGSLLQYKGGKWVNAEISTEGMVTTDSRSTHPMHGKHFFIT